MLKLVIFLSAAACALSSSIPEFTNFVIGGSPIYIRSAPWQVAVYRHGVFQCGGSIYNKYIIITAAHCLPDGPAFFLKVRVGSTERKSGGILIRVAEYKRHEGFVAGTWENDIGVIRLKSSIKYSFNVQKITLASSAPVHGTAAVAYGWGQTKVNGSYPEKLHHVNVRIVGRSQCSSSYGSRIKTHMICAAAPGKDACQGDSGGPLVSHGVLVGVTSFGTDCAHAKYPGVYADVAYYRSWIIRAASSFKKNYQVPISIIKSILKIYLKSFT